MGSRRTPSAPVSHNRHAQDRNCPRRRRKESGCLRTITGTRQFCAVRSYLPTAAKHGLSGFDVLAMPTQGPPWMPAIG
jgi:hypothetical protein